MEGGRLPDPRSQSHPKEVKAMRCCPESWGHKGVTATPWEATNSQKQRRNTFVSPFSDPLFLPHSATQGQSNRKQVGKGVQEREFTRVCALPSRAEQEKVRNPRSESRLAKSRYRTLLDWLQTPQRSKFYQHLSEQYLILMGVRLGGLTKWQEWLLKVGSGGRKTLKQNVQPVPRQT